MAINIKQGVGDLVERFRQGGESAAVDSWIERGPNTGIDEAHLEKALGPDLIDNLVQQTDLSRQVLLPRLALVLPGVR